MEHKGIPGTGQGAVISMIGELTDEFGLFGPDSRTYEVGFSRHWTTLRSE
jgi:hypothetical protein